MSFASGPPMDKRVWMFGLFCFTWVVNVFRCVSSNGEIERVYVVELSCVNPHIRCVNRDEFMEEIGNSFCAYQ